MRLCGDVSVLSPGFLLLIAYVSSFSEYLPLLGFFCGKEESKLSSIFYFLMMSNCTAVPFL